MAEDLEAVEFRVVDSGNVERAFCLTAAGGLRSHHEPEHQPAITLALPLGRLPGPAEPGAVGRFILETGELHFTDDADNCHSSAFPPAISAADCSALVLPEIDDATISIEATLQLPGAETRVRYDFRNGRLLATDFDSSGTSAVSVIAECGLAMAFMAGRVPVPEFLSFGGTLNASVESLSLCVGLLMAPELEAWWMSRRGLLEWSLRFARVVLASEQNSRELAVLIGQV